MKNSDYRPLSQNESLPKVPKFLNHSINTKEEMSRRSWIVLNRNLRCLLLSLLVLIIYGIVRYFLYFEYEYQNPKNSQGPEDTSLFEILHDNKSPQRISGVGHRKPSDFTIPSLDSEWYDTNCFSGSDSTLGSSISDIYEKLERMKLSRVPECREIFSLFDKMFSMEYIQAPIVLPKGFVPEVKGWLGNDPELFEQVNHQKVYKVVIKGSHEETVFNPIRSKRPTSKSLINPLDYITNLSLTTEPTCDFCKYKDHTAQDTFGRIDNEYSASASNTFKLAKFHGLFFPKTHHPVNISHEALADLFVNTSQQWFTKAHAEDSKQRYPSLLWDMLPHAGASQVHIHIHGILDVHHYAGSFEKMHAVSQEYFKEWGRSYWTDLIKVHWALGLGIRLGSAVAVVPLFSRKDHEYFILSQGVDVDFVNMIYKMMQGYKESLGVYCFSSGGAYPFIGEVDEELDSYSEPGLPTMFRFGSRGVCTSITSDVSSLELYTVNNINSDLAVTFKALKDSIQNTKLISGKQS